MKKVVKLVGFVNSENSFTDQPKVIVRRLFVRALGCDRKGLTARGGHDLCENPPCSPRCSGPILFLTPSFNHLPATTLMSSEPPSYSQVINGASDLMVEVFGDVGRHARSAVGVNVLPLGVTTEVEAIVELFP